MKVNPNVNSGIQSTQADKLQKSDQASRTDKARQVEKARQDFKTPPSTNTSANAEISSKAKDAAKAHVVAATTPDVREDRVAELKRKIAEGTYKVDSDAIADKMIREHSAM